VAGTPQPPPEVAAYYAAFAEEDRLASGLSQLEFERTRQILTGVLPPRPATIVVGAAGRYSLWLAGQGYDVYLGVEGLGERLTDFDERWADPPLRDDLLDIARGLEAEPSIVGASAHLLAVGRRTEQTLELREIR